MVCHFSYPPVCAACEHQSIFCVNKLVYLLLVVWLFIPEQPHRLLGFEFPEEHRKTSPNLVILDLEGHGVRGWQIHGLLLLPIF